LVRVAYSFNIVWVFGADFIIRAEAADFPGECFHFSRDKNMSGKKFRALVSLEAVQADWIVIVVVPRVRFVGGPDIGGSVLSWRRVSRRRSRIWVCVLSILEVGRFVASLALEVVEAGMVFLALRLTVFWLGVGSFTSGKNLP
jgi:hypothetical protein